MRQTLLVFAVGLALTGCTPMVWMKPGASLTERQRDTEECQSLASDQAFREGWMYGSPFGPWHNPWHWHSWGPAPYDRYGRRFAPHWQHDWMMERMMREQALLDCCMRARGYRLTPIQ